MARTRANFAGALTPTLSRKRERGTSRQAVAATLVVRPSAPIAVSTIWRAFSPAPSYCTAGGILGQDEVGRAHPSGLEARRRGGGGGGDERHTLGDDAAARPPPPGR